MEDMTVEPDGPIANQTIARVKDPKRTETNGTHKTLILGFWVVFARDCRDQNNIIGSNKSRTDHQRLIEGLRRLYRCLDTPSARKHVR